MTEQEGVIKYHLTHNQQPIEQAFPLTELNAWRSVALRLGLIGQDPQRYDNIGFGNISCRLDATPSIFVITGTQTGQYSWLTAEQFSLVLSADPKKNRLSSLGFSKPSSEALTHASVYTQDRNIRAIIHAHSPDIWQQTLSLGLPHTNAEIPYGTVAMADAVEQLFLSGALEQKALFTMLGHQDGVVAFGPNLEKAAWELIKHLTLAISK